MSLISRHHARVIGSIPRRSGRSPHQLFLRSDYSAVQIPRNFYNDMSRAAFTSTSRSTPIPLSTLRLIHHTSLRHVSTESHRPSSDSAPPPPVSTSTTSNDLTKVPPPGSAPPAPPVKLDAVPPKSEEIAEETVKQQEIAKKDTKPKGSLPSRAWATVKKEAAHYWAGTKLLGHEIKISAKLLRVVLRGEELTRRERRQVSYRLFIKRGIVAYTVAATNDRRSLASDSLLGLCHCPIHGALPSFRNKAIPQHAA